MCFVPKPLRYRKFSLPRDRQIEKGRLNNRPPTYRETHFRFGIIYLPETIACNYHSYLRLHHWLDSHKYRARAYT